MTEVIFPSPMPEGMFQGSAIITPSRKKNSRFKLRMAGNKHSRALHVSAEGGKTRG